MIRLIRRQLLKMKNLDKEEINALKILITNIKKQYDINEIVLYGSKSRGDYNEYSDVDLLIITNNKLNAKELDNIFSMSSSVNVDFGVAFSCLIVNQEDWINEKNINPFLKSNIEKEGVSIAV